MKNYRFFEILDVIAATNEESNPPERSTPYGTSHISLFLTASIIKP